jgi:hypothetical protein
MDNRARASLTYRILTDVLGVTLVFGAFSLSTITDYTVATLVRNVVLYALVFAVLIMIWRRLGSMFDLGILGGKVSGLIGMFIALNIALAPVFLKVLISQKEAVQSFAANWLAVSFGLIMLLMMFLVRRSHAYKSKTHWRLVHHTLLVTGLLFLASPVVSLTLAPVKEIPAGFLLWMIALLATPVIQRLGSNMVANPAQPQRATSSASTTNSMANAPLADADRSGDERDSRDGREGQDQHRRPPRRGGGRGRFHRHSGPSRRRM